MPLRRPRSHHHPTGRKCFRSQPREGVRQPNIYRTLDFGFQEQASTRESPPMQKQERIDRARVRSVAQVPGFGLTLDRICWALFSRSSASHRDSTGEDQIQVYSESPSSFDREGGIAQAWPCPGSRGRNAGSDRGFEPVQMIGTPSALRSRSPEDILGLGSRIDLFGRRPGVPGQAMFTQFVHPAKQGEAGHGEIDTN